MGITYFDQFILQVPVYVLSRWGNEVAWQKISPRFQIRKPFNCSYSAFVNTGGHYMLATSLVQTCNCLCCPPFLCHKQIRCDDASSMPSYQNVQELVSVTHVKLLLILGIILHLMIIQLMTVKCKNVAKKKRNKNLVTVVWVKRSRNKR